MAEEGAEVREGETRVESPPPAPQPERGGGAAAAADEPRARLHQLAERLTRARPRQLLVEYLQLRRSLM